MEKKDIILEHKNKGRRYIKRISRGFIWRNNNSKWRSIKKGINNCMSN